MKLKNMSAIILGLAVSAGTAHAAPDAYETNPAKLAPSKRALYEKAKNTINDWSGEHDKLAAAAPMIKSLINSEPRFLPIYIEQARLAIMTGTQGKNDFLKFNRDALAIVQELSVKDPSYAKPYVLAGHIYQNLNELDNARSSLEQAGRLKTTDPWLYINWCELLVRTKQYDAAVAYARKGLRASTDDGKAMANAISCTNKSARYSAQAASSQDITALVFKEVKDPLQRLGIANRLAGANSGDATLLAYAYNLIMRQKKETPTLREADLALAEWFLLKGYLSNQNHVARYDEQFSTAAARLLDQLPNTASMKNRIFEARFSIAMSDRDLKQANSLIAAARASGIARETVLVSQAKVLWTEGNHAGVIGIYDDLAKLDPAYDGDKLQLAAYARLGDNSKLDAYHLRQVTINPSDAWTLGNYAGYLLSAGRLASAIEYGEKAMAQSSYPIVRETTAIALLLRYTRKQESPARPTPTSRAPWNWASAKNVWPISAAGTAPPSTSYWKNTARTVRI
jgi:Tfp pilus assembly protein PilF